MLPYFAKFNEFVVSILYFGPAAALQGHDDLVHGRLARIELQLVYIQPHVGI